MSFWVSLVWIDNSPDCLLDNTLEVQLVEYHIIHWTRYGCYYLIYIGHWCSLLFQTSIFTIWDKYIFNSRQIYLHFETNTFCNITLSTGRDMAATISYRTLLFSADIKWRLRRLENTLACSTASNKKSNQYYPYFLIFEVYEYKKHKSIKLLI